MSCVAWSFDWDPDAGLVNPSHPLASAGACQAHPNSSENFRMSRMTQPDLAEFNQTRHPKTDESF